MQPIVVVALAVVMLAAACTATDCPTSVPAFAGQVADGFCAWEVAAHLQRPRGMIVTPNQHLLVVASNQGAIVAYALSNGTTTLSNPVTLVTLRGLNHGIAFHNNYLYASSQTTVYRWPYADDLFRITHAAQQVVAGIPAGGHNTRTLRFHPSATHLLLVSCGSQANIDADASTRSQIRAFDLSRVDADGATAWLSGQLLATGLRNAVAFNFDSWQRLWACPNGMDQVSRADLGGDVHNDNPAEELVLVERAGQNFGYPYCWAQYNLDSTDSNVYQTPPGTLYATDPSSAWTDRRCRTEATPPKWVFQAHMAPIDMVFWPTDAAYFPPAWRRDGFLSFHGSWNRDVPVGHLVKHFHFDEDTGMPSADETLIYSASMRPTGMAVGPCLLGACLYIADDTAGKIYAVGYPPVE